MKKTLIIFALILAMVMQLVPFSALAAEEVVTADPLEAQLLSGVDAKTDLNTDMDEVITNPLYPENAAWARANHVNAQADVEAETLEWMYLSDALDYFAKCLENRQYYITFETRLNFEPYLETLDAMFALACEHNGIPTQGDYITWHWTSYSRGGSQRYSGGYYYVTCEFYFEYYTTKSQETALTNRVNQIISSMNFNSSTTDFQKAYAIYDWVTSNIAYDYTGLNAGDPMAQTSYKGVMQGTTVCQGYASTMYRMLLEVGVDARVIAGDGGGPHGWNIAKIDGKWYNLDSTWDDENSPANWEWFLKCPANFPYHYRWEEYDTSEFHADYPMATSDYRYSAPKKNGICDVNGVWGYYVDDVLQTWFTGLVEYNGTWMYVQNGLVNWNYQGLVFFNGYWFYVDGGFVDWNYTGLTQYGGYWFYVSGGQVDWNYIGLTCYNGWWFYVENGQVNWDYVGLTQYNGWWFYVANGMVDWGYNSLTQFNGYWFYVSDGLVNWDYVGLVYFNGCLFYVQNGQVNWGYNGSAYYNGMWYNVVGGIAQ